MRPPGESTEKSHGQLNWLLLTARLDLFLHSLADIFWARNNLDDSLRFCSFVRIDTNEYLCCVSKINIEYYNSFADITLDFSYYFIHLHYQYFHCVYFLLFVMILLDFAKSKKALSLNALSKIQKDHHEEQKVVTIRKKYLNKIVEDMSSHK